MKGDFCTLVLRDDLKIRKGSKLHLMFGQGSVEVRVSRIYMDNHNMVWVECVNSKGVGSVHSAHNLQGYGVLKKY